MRPTHMNPGDSFPFRWLILAVVALALLPAILPTAQANNCWNSDRTMYDCSSYSGGSVGASAPIIGDTLETNPANLPSVPTPFGLEFLLHDRSTPHKKMKPAVSTVKGFDGLGFGIGSWSDGTFVAPDFPNHFLGTSYYREYQNYENDLPGVLGLRLGLTLVSPKKTLPDFMRISVGASAGFGRLKGSWAPQVGAVIKLWALGVGYAESFEHLSRPLPATRVKSLTVGFFLGPAYFSYARSDIVSSVNRTNSHSVGMRLSLRKWTAHGGWKTQRDHRGKPDEWYRGGLHRRLGKRLSLGYEYGYYRHSHSASLQVFL